MTSNFATPAQPRSVWMDVDVSIGLPEAEVDDGLALLQAFHSPELRVVGVSAVFGNTTLENAVIQAREIVRRFGRPGLDVYQGAASASDLGRRTQAVEALAAALRRERLTILALGPLTTIGTLLSLHPELSSQIDTVVVVAGRRPGQRFTTGQSGRPHRDFNFELDPDAMDRLLRSQVGLVLAPWEVSSHVEITLADLGELRTQGEAGLWVASSCQSWIGLWKKKFGVDFFNPFDTLAVAWVTHPDLLECMDAAVWIEQGPDDRETSGTKLKPYLLAAPDRGGQRRATYCFQPMPQLKAVILDRLVGK